MPKRLTRKRSAHRARKPVSKPSLAQTGDYAEPIVVSKPIRDVIKLPKVGKFARALAWIMRKHHKRASDSSASIIPHPTSNPSAHRGKRAHAKEGSC